MKICGTSNNMPFSKLIRWALHESSSHLIFHFNNGVSTHSNPLGLHLTWTNTFNKTNVTHWEIDVATTTYQENEIIKTIMDNHDSDEYDWPAFFYMAWCLLLKILFKKPIPKLNKWGNPDMCLCVALPSKTPSWFLGNMQENEIEMLSPNELSTLIIKELKSKNFSFSLKGL